MVFSVDIAQCFILFIGICVMMEIAMVICQCFYLFSVLISVLFLFVI